MTPQRTIDQGFFISLEGPEGAGKSTQQLLLAEALRKQGYEVHLTREPGGTELGEKLRQLIKYFHGQAPVASEAELLLFGACRAQLMQEVIQPRLAAGSVVICDRFTDSTTVYQGCARGLPAEFIERMHAFTINDRWPDLTLLIDIDVETSFRRAQKRGKANLAADRFESESRDFHQKVRQGFLDLAAAHPKRIHIVSGMAPAGEVHQTIMEIADRALGSI
jgi:dTMP kinase